MRLSYSALNRITEERAAELRAEGKRVRRPAQYVLSEARRLSEVELLQRLWGLGLEMDRQRLSPLVARHCSAEEIAKECLDYWRPGCGQSEMEGDWFWFALTILWERWFPEVPNFERLDDAMQRGYELMSKPEGCDIWLKAWPDLLKLKAKAGSRSLAEFDDQFGGTQSVFNWFQDFERELGNAAIDHPKYHAERVRVCEEFLRQFEGVDELIVQNTRRACAESIFALGDIARADALYRGWLADDPQWGWGWIGWADLYNFRRTGRKDPARAEELLKQGLAVDQVRDAGNILERLADLYEEQGRQQEAAETQGRRAAIRELDASARNEFPESIAPVQFELGEAALQGFPFPISPSEIDGEPTASVPRAKVGRNEPCPCGSGKKFKKCCAG